MSPRFGLPWLLALVTILGRSYGRQSSFQNKKQAIFPDGRQIVLSRGQSSSSSMISSSHSALPVSNLLEVISVRGGATRSIDRDSSEDGLIIPKLRNLIRSCLRMAEKSPAVFKTLKSFISTVEQVIGVRLLPEKAKSKKKKQKTKESRESPHSKTKQPKEKTTNTRTTGSKTKKSKVHTETKSKSSPVTKTRTVKRKSASSKEKTSESKTRKSKSSPPAETPKSNANKSKPVSVASAKAKAHLEKPLKSNSPNYRIQRELKSFIQEPPDNLSVKVGKNIRVWIVTMKGAANTIYEGESFMLRISFPKDYPTVPPSVYFLPPNIPLHEHIYSNGDICLSLLGKGWRPTMTAQSIALSILSILSSAQSKSLPMDNARHAQNKPGEYQEAWVYHDDGC
jgi:ubiquitin-conjugating enzyme E2 W